MGVGFLASIVFVAYFVAKTYCAVAFSKVLRKEMETETKRRLEKGIVQVSPLGQSLTMNHFKYGFMSKPYEELRNDLNFFEIYYPVVLILRDILISMSVVLLTAQPQAATILTAIVEALFLGYCSVAQVHFKRSVTIVELFIIICRLGYAVAASVTFRYEMVPISLDYAMFIFLLLNTVASLFLMAYIVLFRVAEEVINFYKKSKASVSPAKSPVFVEPVQGTGITDFGKIIPNIDGSSTTNFNFMKMSKANDANPVNSKLQLEGIGESIQLNSETINLT